VRRVDKIMAAVDWNDYAICAVRLGAAQSLISTMSKLGDYALAKAAKSRGAKDAGRQRLLWPEPWIATFSAAIACASRSKGVFTARELNWLQQVDPYTAFPAQHLRPSGVLSCWPDGLELTPGFYPRSNEQHRLF